MKVVEVLGVHADQLSATTVVFLGQPETPTRVLPIFIGPVEARAILLGLSDVEAPRPGTHELMGHVLDACDAELDRVAVTELVDGTFHAILELTTPSGSTNVSARPSDAIALAVRTGAPVLVADQVLAEASVEIQHAPDEPFEEEEIEAIVAEFEQVLETATVSDFIPEDEPETGEDGPDDLDDEGSDGED